MAGKYSVAKQTIVSMFTEMALGIGLPMLKTVNPVVYNDLGWLAQKKPDELRLAIGGTASGIEVIVDLIPHISTEVKDNVEEVLESLRNAVTNYYRDLDLGLPAEYQPKITSVGDFVIEAFGEMKKGVHGSTQKVRGLFAKFAPDHPSLKDNPVTVYETFAAAYPDDLPRLMAFIASLPADAEDDWQRVSPTLPALAIKTLIDMEPEKGVLAVRRMAKNTFGENVGQAFEHVAEPADRFLDETSMGARNARAAARAARRAAASTPATVPTSTA